MAILDLFETLETLLRQHEQMIALGERKREALIANDVGVLNEAVNKESRLIKAIAESEGDWRKVVAGFLAEQGLSGNAGSKISDLVRVLPSSEDKTKLQSLADKLLSIIERLKELNGTNMNLTKQAIEFNEFSLNLITSPFDDRDFVYKKPADYGRSQNSLKLFDSKA
ncbi:flagellar protein FlgN [Cohnella endophytica]|nr:flagellar protein FlgN [Cohnella endophytica]